MEPLSVPWLKTGRDEGNERLAHEGVVPAEELERSALANAMTPSSPTATIAPGDWRSNSISSPDNIEEQWVPPYKKGSGGRFPAPLRRRLYRTAVAGGTLGQMTEL